MTENTYHPGHALHWIQLKQAGIRPWGWRDGLVRSSADGQHVIDYVEQDGSITVWSALLDHLDAGTPVRLHEEFRVLQVGSQAFNVRRDAGGLGAVPEPADTRPWRPLMTSGAASLATGTGFLPLPSSLPPQG